MSQGTIYTLCYGSRWVEAVLKSTIYIYLIARDKNYTSKPSVGRMKRLQHMFKFEREEVLKD